jgi:O-antigen/teichoic acid export membrane protein
MIKKIIKQGTGSGNLHSLLGNMIFATFSFVTFFIMVRTLDKAMFGQWVLFVTMASLLDMFRLGLTGTAAIRLISRAKPEKIKRIGASSYKLGAYATLVISILLFTGYYFAHRIYPDSYYLPILLFYPLLALVNLPFHQANIVAQGKVNFKRVMKLRIINGVFILFFVTGYILFSNATVQGVIIVYIIANLLSSCITIIAGWDELKHFRKADKKTIRSILHFGKYSTASFVGSSLLRSSDTIILSLAPFLGAEAIAIYAVPLKFAEAVEIPLRSFTATAFPRLSQSLKKGNQYFKSMLFSYTFWSTTILLPAVLALSLFPSFFLQFIGGAQYADSLPTQTSILYIICFYILILPLDRYSGVALFALDKPKLNFYKIFIMLVANIIFDCIAVFVFNSLLYVAFATLIFTILGIFLGWNMLFRETEIKYYPGFIADQMEKYRLIVKQTFKSVS